MLSNGPKGIFLPWGISPCFLRGGEGRRRENAFKILSGEDLLFTVEYANRGIAVLPMTQTVP